MRTLSQLLILCFVAALTACGVQRQTYTPEEDCNVVGDEDGNGKADCDDPACAGEPACRPMCGNHKVEAGEECDDGNAIDGDACETNCTLPVCGNGIKDAGEQCDDGNGVDGDACETNCTLPVCGNGIKDSGEECDDGNGVEGDACENNCTLPVCGNGIRDANEECDDGNDANGDACENNCTLPACGNGIKDVGEQCDDGNAVNSDGCDNTCVISPLAYLKASNAGVGDEFGVRVALSADGSTLAVGAIFESSAATGSDGDQGDDSAGAAGAVYVFTRSGTTWRQQAYLKASNTGAGDQFGASLALSADGSTLVVGAPLEDSAAVGIGGNQASDAAADAGAVYVFTRRDETWSQQAYVKASNTGAGDNFGGSVALSADGTILAVGAIGEDSGATGINNNQNNNSSSAAGAVYVFTSDGEAWTQQAYVKASNTGVNDNFGWSVALSGNGSTLAIGAIAEASAAVGVGGNQADNSAGNAGAVYVFTRGGSAWSQDAYVKASNTGTGDKFGSSVALSSDGTTLAVGAAFEKSAATGIDGNQGDNSAVAAGAAYVLVRGSEGWDQQAYLKASNTGVADEFGVSVALSGDGSTLAVGGLLEDSAATGVGGNQLDNTAPNSGAVYVFGRNDTAWSQRAYVKSSNTSVADDFGVCVALSADASVLAVGAFGEDSAATGIAGDQADDSAESAGAVYVLQGGITSPATRPARR